MIAPTNIRGLRELGLFEIDWPDGVRARYPFRLLRQLCPCAGCVDELTGIRTLDPESVDESIAPLEVDFVGNYALKIRWSDNHDTGLFTWANLHGMRENDSVVTSSIDS